MAAVRFAKMEALGNRFVILDGVSHDISVTSELVQRLAKFQTGCDQVLLLERTSSSDMTLRYRIWNSDGGEVAQCGNGARCIPKYLAHCLPRFRSENGTLYDNEGRLKRLRLETANGYIHVELDEQGRTRVRLSEPNFEPRWIPFKPSKAESWPGFNGLKEFHALSVGNPHAVFVLKDRQGEALENSDLNGLAASLRSTGCFPEGVNVGICQRVSEDVFGLRVDERGAGETQSCGSGAAAAGVALMRHHGAQGTVRIRMRGGELTVRWKQASDMVSIEGDVSDVLYEGTMDTGQVL